MATRLEYAPNIIVLQILIYTAGCSFRGSIFEKVSESQNDNSETQALPKGI